MEREDLLAHERAEVPAFAHSTQPKIPRSSVAADFDPRVAIELFRELESDFDVNEIAVAGIRMWPVLRLHLWRRLTHASRTDSSRSDSDRDLRRSEKPSLRDRFHQLIHDFCAHCHQRLPKVDALFYLHETNYAVEIEGELYFAHLDPVLELARTHWNAQKIQLAGPAAHPAHRQRHMPQELSPHHSRRLQKVRRRVFPQNIRGLEEIAKQIRRRCGVPGALSVDQFLRECDQVVAHASFFRGLLANAPPRAVFVVCYYAYDSMGLLAACRSLGVPTVDLQHGKQGKFHGLYAGWNRIPPGGYELLPDWFWVWGPSTEEEILETYSPSPFRPRTVVGGYPWLARWQGEGQYRKGSAEESLDEWVAPGSLRILVSLQPQAGFFDRLCKAISLAPSQWRWLLRFHPCQDEIAREAILRKLSLAGIRDRVETKYASRVPLPYVLKRVDIHVTSFSSVIYEAQAFGVPSLVIGPTGRTFYEREIESGLVRYALTGSEIVAALAALSTSPPIPQQAHVVHAPSAAASALQRILGEPQRNH